jgi:hypothetical protein
MKDSRRMRWAGHVPCTGRCGNAFRTSMKNLKGIDHPPDEGVGGSRACSIIIDLMEIVWESEGWIHLALGGGLTSCCLQEGLCFMKLVRS